jgi:uncharacterized protein (TIGR00369 family)
MKICTHEKIDRRLCGEPLNIKSGYSKVHLLASAEMAVDDFGLIHGGFVFGLADYAAMIAVNDPNVVLGAAEVKFLKPTVKNDTLVAEAQVSHEKGNKRMVSVVVINEDTTVFTGTFTCFVLEKHILS